MLLLFRAVNKFFRAVQRVLRIRRRLAPPTIQEEDDDPFFLYSIVESDSENSSSGSPDRQLQQHTHKQVPSNKISSDVSQSHSSQHHNNILYKQSNIIIS